MSLISKKIDPNYAALQTSVKEILQREDDLTEIVQLVGKDSLSEDQKCTLEMAKLIREDFLQQNGFSEYDYRCPLKKTIKMMALIVDFHDRSQRLIGSASGEARITWNEIYKHCYDEYFELTKMKFEMPEAYYPDVKVESPYFDNILKKQIAALEKLEH